MQLTIQCEFLAYVSLLTQKNSNSKEKFTFQANQLFSVDATMNRNSIFVFILPVTNRNFKFCFTKIAHRVTYIKTTLIKSARTYHVPFYSVEASFSFHCQL